MAQLTKLMIRKLIKEELENTNEFTPEKAIKTLENIDQGYKPVGDDIKKIIALIKKLSSGR